jgi:hypothetical protein
MKLLLQLSLAHAQLILVRAIKNPLLGIVFNVPSPEHKLGLAVLRVFHHIYDYHIGDEKHGLFQRFVHCG